MENMSFAYSEMKVREESKMIFEDLTKQNKNTQTPKLFCIPGSTVVSGENIQRQAV